MTGLVPNVYAAICIPVPASTLALMLRLKARRMTRMGIGFDDGFAVAAWVLAVAYAVDLFIWATCFKLGQRLGSYSEQTVDYYMEKSFLVLWVSEFIFAWSIFFSKMAVLYFYRRLKFSTIRVPIIVLMVACCVWVTIRTFFTIFHCIPVQAYWDKSIKNARCLTNVSDFYLGTNVTHCSMDFIILCLPIYEVITMRLPFGQKIAVVGLFATGSLVGIASIFQITQTRRYNPATEELPYQLGLSMAWGNVEVHLAVFVGSLALLRPIFRKFIPGLSTENSPATSCDGTRARARSSATWIKRWFTRRVRASEGSSDSSYLSPKVGPFPYTSDPSRRSSTAFQPVLRPRGARCPIVIETPDLACEFDHCEDDMPNLAGPKGKSFFRYQEWRIHGSQEPKSNAARYSLSSIC